MGVCGGAASAQMDTSRHDGATAKPTSAVRADGSAQKAKRRRPRTLLLLLKSLMGLRVRIDLKNDTSVEGLVQEVVHDMDFTLLDAVETKPNGDRIHFDEVFVMGKMILYVHIPDRINLNQQLQNYIKIIRKSATMYTRSKRK
ncbi:TPA: hypothetical protein N0F65_002345 [Lagenidium giganteum]|uniref:Sm domain-containing protein n=1 Tax=Lagenidium giganteum TaxID=4803 RepID=A0AAV2Z642_9STRA|nr:TPA: hypothetical protein N0F65_002345 [Lagenidium giganteum]